MSNRARPLVLLTIPLTLCPPSFFLEKGPTRSPRAGKRRGGGTSPSRMGRRGEGVPTWSGFSSSFWKGFPGGAWSAFEVWGGVKEGRRVEAAPRDSRRLRVCSVPAPPPPRRELPGACVVGSPFLSALSWGLRARVPHPSSDGARDPPGAASCGPGPSDLGCPRGWATDLLSDLRLTQPSPNKFQALL